MKLTSYRRMLRYLAGQDNDNKTDDWKSRRDIESWISSVSNTITKYIGYDIEQKYRTEKIDILDKNQHIFHCQAAPIVSVSYVSWDSTGEHAEPNYLDSDSYRLAENYAYIIVDDVQGYETPVGLDIGYTAGLATHGVNSTFAVSSISGTIVPGQYCLGESSNAAGYVISVNGSSVTNEILYGVFEIGETLHFHTSEEGVDTQGISASLTSKTIESLAETNPDIVNACEIEVRYKWKHKHDFENISTDRNGTTQRFSQSGQFGLQDQTIQMLLPYKRILPW